MTAPDQPRASDRDELIKKVTAALAPFAHAHKHAEYYVPEALPDEFAMAFPKSGTYSSGDGPTPFRLTYADFRRAADTLDLIAELKAPAPAKVPEDVQAVIDGLRAGLIPTEEVEASDRAITLYDIGGAEELMEQGADALTAATARIAELEADRRSDNAVRPADAGAHHPGPTVVYYGPYQGSAGSADGGPAWRDQYGVLLIPQPPAPQDAGAVPQPVAWRKKIYGKWAVSTEKLYQDDEPLYTSLVPNQPGVGEPVADRIDLDIEPGVERPLSAETQAALREIDAHRGVPSQPAPSPVGMEGWRDIATAPNDRGILIWDGKDGGAHLAWWSDDFEGNGEGAWTDWAALSLYSGNYRTYQPTHWMPLPKPPGSFPSPPEATAGVGERRSAGAILEFTNLILHGDAEHRRWLMEAANAYLDGNPLPPPRSVSPAQPEAGTPEQGKGVTVTREMIGAARRAFRRIGYHSTDERMNAALTAAIAVMTPATLEEIRVRYEGKR